MSIMDELRKRAGIEQTYEDIKRSRSGSGAAPKDYKAELVKRLETAIARSETDIDDSALRNLVIVDRTGKKGSYNTRYFEGVKYRGKDLDEGLRHHMAGLTAKEKTQKPNRLAGRGVLDGHSGVLNYLKVMRDAIKSGDLDGELEKIDAEIAQTPPK